MKLAANSVYGRVRVCLLSEYETNPNRLYQVGDKLDGEFIPADDITPVEIFESVEDFEGHNFDGTESGRQIVRFSDEARELFDL